jgi:hypothetical protein
MPDGEVLVAGGETECNGTWGCGQTANSELYSPQTGQWQLVGSLNIARYWDSAVLLPDGKVLVVGGQVANQLTDPDPSRSAELFDPSTKAWTPTGSLHYQRSGTSLVVLHDGLVLAVDGVTYADLAAGHGGSTELYNPATGLWSDTGSLLTARNGSGATATLLPDGRVLLAGGADASCGCPTTDAELYDPASGTWSRTGSLGTARDGHQALLFTGAPYVPGGVYVGVVGGAQVIGGSAPNSAETWNEANGTWTGVRGFLNTERLGGFTATLSEGGYAVVVGGFTTTPGGSGTGQTSSIEYRDPVSHSWIAANSIPFDQGIAQHATVLLNDGSLLIMGGTLNDAGECWLAQLL